ncbi:nitrogen fixation protein NifZ [Nitrospirillum sp. BR 11163]|uniref:nitrogen fixation protein NifZ n=1 Tax=Nitrospirillum sp. BR 11163 TaxID=3104323 RepID=UPI002AFE3A66|nr:nitrogen fixation protein NifZ [Nitrospirillum sp. BR 11163]MEA1675930.1 nitrogen fixation protein NifZ [Nitrospirillum sp. BR 11163]
MCHEQHRPRQRRGGDRRSADLHLRGKGALPATVRNDGTYAGKEIGDILARKGEEGYVVSIGTFLQQFYIYGVEFLGSGNRVGMKRKELEAVLAVADEDDMPLPTALPVPGQPAGGRP